MRESWSELLAAPTKYGHLPGAVPTKYDEDGIAIEPQGRKGRYEVAALGSETASMRWARELMPVMRPPLVSSAPAHPPTALTQATYFDWDGAYLVWTDESLATFGGEEPEEEDVLNALAVLNWVKGPKEVGLCLSHRYPRLKQAYDTRALRNALKKRI